jgi:hypothetical protein
MLDQMIINLGRQDYMKKNTTMYDQKLDKLDCVQH